MMLANPPTVNSTLHSISTSTQAWVLKLTSMSRNYNVEHRRSMLC